MFYLGPAQMMIGLVQLLVDPQPGAGLMLGVFTCGGDTIYCAACDGATVTSPGLYLLC